MCRFFRIYKQQKNEEFLCGENLVQEELGQSFKNIYWVMMWKRDQNYSA